MNCAKRRPDGPALLAPRRVQHATSCHLSGDMAAVIVPSATASFCWALHLQGYSINASQQEGMALETMQDCVRDLRTCFMGKPCLSCPPVILNT